METLEALGASLETSAEIQSIVRTMKALSSASIRQYEHAAEAMSDYERTVDLGLQVVLRDRRARGAPPLDLAERGQRGHRPALVVVGSDRGLCGRFNDRIADFARGALTEDRPAGTPDPMLAVLGLRVAARLETAGWRADRLIGLPGSVAGLVATAQAVVIGIERWTREADVGPVDIVFNSRGAGQLAVPARRALLPVPRRDLAELARRPWESPRLPIFRMEAGPLFSWLIREHLFVVVYRALADSLASEHASRLAAMQSAERNIEEHRAELLGRYRRKRQETITRELLDLVAGFESVAAED